MADIMPGQLLHRATIDSISDSSPLPVRLSGTLPEKASAQHSEIATTAKTYNRAVGASRLEVYVEAGRIGAQLKGQFRRTYTPGFDIRRRSSSDLVGIEVIEWQTGTQR